MQLKKLAQLTLKNTPEIVSMNGRNLDYVYPSNARKYFQLADNKIKTKELLASADIKVPKTYMVINHFFEIETFAQTFDQLHEFVIKPAQGSGGNGIIVVVAKKDGLYTTAGHKYLTRKDIQKHIGDILFGVYSKGMNDSVIVEERLIQHTTIENLSPNGLADFRIICYKKKLAIAMLRLATLASDGKANLHQGGIGVAINMTNGQTVNAQIKRQNISAHPDNGANLLNISIPFWEEIKELSTKVAQIMPLDYIGIDIALTHTGPVILEVNVRPGIEIQNIHNSGMRMTLEALR